ncbi:MAG: AfsR/SARP family transcriptional regulator [Nocardioides sp.]
MNSIEVRLLGPLVVRRVDGSIVRASEWKTTKTLDLLRLLALKGGRPMTVSAVIDRLWPRVDWDRGRASLRTAASQLRKTLGTDCIERRAGSLVLVDAWVDTWAYTDLVHEVDLARRAGDAAGVVALTRRAEALYAGDIEVTAGEWDSEACEWFREHRLRMLIDGSTAAASCGWMRDSLELAHRASGVELTESVARALMRAHAGLGETARALDVYESMRRDLAERLGVDPAPQTRALHMKVLTGTAGSQPRPQPIGIDGPVSALVAATRSLAETADPPGVVWLCGPAGAGRSLVAGLAADELGLPLYDVSELPFDSYATRLLDGGNGAKKPGLVLLSCRSIPPPWAVGIVHALADRYAGLIVVRCTECPEGIGVGDAARDIVVRMGPLDAHELETMARMLLQGEPSPELVRRLRHESAGLAGAATAVIRGWLDNGMVIWREDGLAVAEPSEQPPDFRAAKMFRAALRTMDAAELDTLCVLAVCGTTLSAMELAEAVAAIHPAASLEGVIGRLLDYGFVVEAPSGYRIARDSLGEELASWIRPTMRNRINEVLAATVPADLVTRARRLMAAGQSASAVALVQDGLKSARREGDVVRLRELAELLRSIAVSSQAGSGNSAAGAVRLGRTRLGGLMAPVLAAVSSTTDFMEMIALYLPAA